MNFIVKKQIQQSELATVFETLCPNCYCDTFIYSEYEEMLVKLLVDMFQDKDELIAYKLYEFDDFSEEAKKHQLANTPEVDTWEGVYDYLVKNMEDNHNE